MSRSYAFKPQALIFVLFDDAEPPRQRLLLLVESGAEELGVAHRQHGHREHCDHLHPHGSLVTGW